MWNSQLIACARQYPSGVLTIVEQTGSPMSVRCVVQYDDGQQVITVPHPPPLAANWRGKACLLFHRHKEDLGDQHEMMIKGTLDGAEGRLIFQPTEFLTGSGRQDTDRMPVAGTPLDMMKFMLLGRRKAREYLARRGAPWPPRPWDKMIRYLEQG